MQEERFIDLYASRKLDLAKLAEQTGIKEEVLCHLLVEPWECSAELRERVRRWAAETRGITLSYAMPKVPARVLLGFKHVLAYAGVEQLAELSGLSLEEVKRLATTGEITMPSWQKIHKALDSFKLINYYVTLEDVKIVSAN